MNRSQAAAALGRIGGPIGGKSRSQAKIAAAHRNGTAPPRPGSRPRGRPKASTKPGGKPAAQTVQPLADASQAAAVLGSITTARKKLSGKRNIAKAIAARWQKDAKSEPRT